MLGDRAAVIHEGRIEQAGPPRELYERPLTAFVASFLGRCALLPGRLHDGRVVGFGQGWTNAPLRRVGRREGAPVICARVCQTL